MNNILSVHTFRFIALVFFQVLVLNHINFFGYINPYIYILFIVLYPIKNNRLTFILLSFLLGLTVDIFQDTGGINAAASVFLAYSRPLFLKFAFGNMYEHQTIKVNTVEFGSKFTYLTILTVTHHFILFTLEVFSFSRIILILEKTIYSSIFTILLSIILTIIFSKKNK